MNAHIDPIVKNELFSFIKCLLMIWHFINTTNFYHLGRYDHSTKELYAFSFNLVQQLSVLRGRGGGEVVRVLAFDSDDPSSNPAEANSFFSVKFVFDKNKKKQTNIAHLKNIIFILTCVSLDTLDQFREIYVDWLIEEQPNSNHIW